MTTLKIIETPFCGAARQYTIYEMNGETRLAIGASSTRKGAEKLMEDRRFEINRKRMDELK
jgi:hypothetical protein